MAVLFSKRALPVFCLTLFLSLLSTNVYSQEINSSEIAVELVEPPTSLIASDLKYDDGKAIILNWVPSVDDQLRGSKVASYKIYRTNLENNEKKIVAELPKSSSRFVDQNAVYGEQYKYSVSAVMTDESKTEVSSTLTEVISPEREWINYSKKYLFLISIILAGFIIYFIETARRGKELFVRKIAGLEAIDEAVGRATEMGRPILFIPGIQDMDDVQTLAGLTILGRVSRIIADYDSKIFVPVSRSLVMTAAREVIKASYQAAARPDAYSDDMVNYITDEQFGYVAHVDGLMIREKPATVFMLGAFFAESLILAETGNSIGAIQIAGTARPAQIPFFIAACDFTLIGEELFAASAYLSGDPKQLGSLKGQDVGKVIAMFFIIVGTLSATIAAAWDLEIANSVLGKLNEIFRQK